MLKNNKRQTTKLTFFALANLGSMFFLYWLPIAILGTGTATDELFSALAIPQVLATVLSSNIIVVLLPILIEERRSENNSGSINGIAIYSAVGFLILLLIIASVTTDLIELIYASYSSDRKNQIESLVQLSLIGCFFNLLCAIYSANSYAIHAPHTVEISGGISGILVIPLATYFLLVFPSPVEYLLWCINARWALFFMLLYLHSDSRNQINFDCSSIGRKVRSRIGILLTATSVTKSDVLFDRHFSSQSTEGDLTILHLVQQVYTIIGNVLNKVVVMPLSAKLSEKFSQQQFDQAKRQFNKAEKELFKLAFGLASVVFMSSLLINLTNADVQILGVTISRWINSSTLLIGALAASTLGTLYTTRFYSVGNTEVPAVIGLFGFMCGIALKFILFRLYGFNGLLVAISLYYSLNLVLLHASRRFLPNYD